MEEEDQVEEREEGETAEKIVSQIIKKTFTQNKDDKVQTPITPKPNDNKQTSDQTLILGSSKAVCMLGNLPAGQDVQQFERKWEIEALKILTPTRKKGVRKQTKII